MKKFIVIFIISIVSIFAITIKNNFSFEYEYHNPSLGPIDGYRHAVVNVEGGKIVSVIDLKSAKVYSDTKKFPMASVIFSILKNPKQKYSNYQVTTNSEGRVTRIDSPSQGFYVNIIKPNQKIQTKREKPNDIFDSRYKYNLKKWQKSNIKSYKFGYKFSSDKKHQEGIEVVVKDGNISYALDEFSRKKVPLNSSVLKIENLFEILKSLIENNRVKEVSFDSLYGFPNYILYNNKYNKPTTIVVSKFLKLPR